MAFPAALGLSPLSHARFSYILYTSKVGPGGILQFAFLERARTDMALCGIGVESSWLPISETLFWIRPLSAENEPDEGWVNTNHPICPLYMPRAPRPGLQV